MKTEDFIEQNKREDEQLMDGEKSMLSDGDRKYLVKTYDNIFDSIVKDEDSFEKKYFRSDIRKYYHVFCVCDIKRNACYK
jgi:hypothetical protein